MSSVQKALAKMNIEKALDKKTGLTHSGRTHKDVELSKVHI